MFSFGGGRSLNFFRDNLLGIILTGILTSVLGTFAYRWIVPDKLSPPPTVIQQPGPREIVKLPPSVSAAPNPKTIELEFWKSVSITNDVEQYREYVRRYPHGEFVGLALAKIAELTAHNPSTPTDTGANPPQDDRQVQPPVRQKKCVTFNDHLICD